MLVFLTAGVLQSSTGEVGGSCRLVFPASGLQQDVGAGCLEGHETCLLGLHATFLGIIYPKSHALACFVFMFFRGKFLDAGTGTHSLKWINTLDTEGFTAVTADPQFADTTRKEVSTVRGILRWRPGRD